MTRQWNTQMNPMIGNARRMGWIIAGLSAPLLLGCSRQTPLVGVWRGAAPVSPGRAVAAVTYEFGADGIVQLSVALPPHAPSASSSPARAMLGMDGISNIHMAGTYTVKGDALAVTTTQMTLLGADGPPPLAPDMKPQTRTLRFHTRGDTLTLDTLDGTPPVLLTRQKI